jgi:hypothetical protein
VISYQRASVPCRQRCDEVAQLCGSGCRRRPVHDDGDGQRLMVPARSARPSSWCRWGGSWSSTLVVRGVATGGGAGVGHVLRAEDAADRGAAPVYSRSWCSPTAGGVLG